MMNTEWMIVCHSTPVAVMVVQALSDRPAAAIAFTDAMPSGELGLPPCGSQEHLTALSTVATALKAGYDLGAVKCTSVTSVGVMWQ
ncbi:MAG TPA: hypothetical protein VM528_10870, partial [Burkholderiaceae bacterium]|nr:hypothetical protein [Burkholderiaceae bacterium]